MLPRYPHIIRENKGADFPQFFIFFDTETKGRKTDENTTIHQLDFGVAVYCERYVNKKIEPKDEILFKRSSELMDFIDSKAKSGRRLLVIAHNIGFDAQIVDIFNGFKERGWERKNTFLSNSAFIVKYRKENKTVVLEDNFNIFKVKLETLGDYVGVQKLQMPDGRASFEIWHKYCRRDVEVMIEAWNVWHKFLIDNNCGNFSYTLAGQAFSAYKHAFMNKNIYIHNNEQALELERAAYHGGRSEAFFIGKAPEQNYYMLDVNSMYPYVMLKYRYPVKLAAYSRVSLIKPKTNVGNSFAGIYALRCDVKNNCVPVFKNNKLIYPIGKFSAFIPEPELEIINIPRLQDTVRECAIYKTDYIFRDYVSYYYRIRRHHKETNNKPFEIISKLFLNSLYGKFGQYNDEWVRDKIYDGWNDGVYDVSDDRYGGLTKVRIISQIAEILTGRKNGFNAFPAIAAFVTSYARALLWKYIIKAGKDHVYYCDTDSLIVDQTGKDNLNQYIDPSRLGALKIEKKGSRLTINGVKDYSLDDKIALKGIKSSAVKIAHNIFLQDKFTTIKGAIRNGNLGHVTIKRTTKHLKRNYDKGEVTETGWVKPFVFD